MLKALVDRLLRQRADVLAFASAPAAQGGTGAVLVLLARRPGEPRTGRGGSVLAVARVAADSIQTTCAGFLRRRD